MFKIVIIVASLWFSSAAFADDDDWDEYPAYPPLYYQPVAPGYYREETVYVPERIVEYIPARPRFYAPPPPVRYEYYDQRTPQGLVGGLVGSAIGYEMGRGDPLATGIGAAAGAWFGNGM
ncbi:hypothetical protein [Methylomonas sp. UP202]|uniref:hypothetical protein n=1 Tax=Methylomonas sp. UP202 TaxID=3040943 RepID=UPI00143A3CCC|nr:hypothetical protein [Methylomonas sp. UP202]NJA04765.1 hypothetical protein [Methylococcaceae bacterium WWC4]WGS87884.1 hypothetical protein QC632_09010 [Methylomonas sp. UP202]